MGVRKGYRALFGARFEDLVGSAARALANSMKEDREDRAAESTSSMNEAHRILNGNRIPPPYPSTAPVITPAVIPVNAGFHFYDGRTGTGYLIVPNVVEGDFAVEVKILGQVQYPTRVFSCYEDARAWVDAAMGELFDRPEPTPVRYNPTDSFIPSRSVPDESTADYEPMFDHNPNGTLSDVDDPDLLVPEPVVNQARHQLGVSNQEAGDLVRQMIEETLETQGRFKVPVWNETHSHTSDTPVWDWEFQSSKPRAGGRYTIYSTLMYRDGCLSCNCPGWTFKKGEETRRCKHTDEVYSESRRYLKLLKARQPLPRRPARGGQESQAPEVAQPKSPAKKQEGTEQEFNRNIEID